MDNSSEGEIPKRIESAYNFEAISLQKNKFIGWLPEYIGNCLLLKAIDLAIIISMGAFLYQCENLDCADILMSVAIHGWGNFQSGLEIQ